MGLWHICARDGLNVNFVLHEFYIIEKLQDEYSKNAIDVFKVISFTFFLSVVVID